MGDRTQYYHDYYQRNKATISKRKRSRKTPEQQIKNNERSKVWRLKNKTALKIAKGLDIKIAEARKLLENVNDSSSC